MRARAALGICSVVAASAAVSALALGQGQASRASSPTTSTWGGAPASDAGSPNDAAPAGRGISTWGNASVPAANANATGDDEDEEEDDSDEDAGSPATAASATADAGDNDAAWEPSNVGLSVGIHGPGYGIPFGTENGSSLSGYAATAMIPIGIDAGWFFTPHFYAGVYFTYGFGLNPGYQNDVCNGTDDCETTVIQVGLAAHWHFLPEAALDPWVGVGLGYEEIIFVGTADDGSTDISHGLPAINASLEGGLDFKPLKYLGFGPYAQLAGGPFVVTDTGWHGWFSFGMRLRTNL